MFKVGDLVEVKTKPKSVDNKKLIGLVETVVDGKVGAIEAHSPYRYLHDAEASARLANMGLRKMVRDSELLQNLTKSKLFEQVGCSPDTPIKEIPKGWRVERLGKIADVGWGDTSKTKSSYVQSGFCAFSAAGPDGFLPYFDFDRRGVVVSAIGANAGTTWLASGKWSCIKNTIRRWATARDRPWAASAAR